MYLMNLITRMVANEKNFRDKSKTLVEVQNTDFFSHLYNFDFVLLLDCSIKNKDWLAFLKLDETYMLVDAFLHYRVPLMMLLHSCREIAISESLNDGYLATTSGLNLGSHNG